VKIIWDEPNVYPTSSSIAWNFADIEEGFDFDGAIVLPAKPSRTDLVRSRFIGELHGALLVAIVRSSLGTEAISSVSLRPASQKERKFHDR
jgi:hypothetical protein